MFDFLTEGSVYDFPSIQATIFALLLSFVLSTIIAFTHKRTFKGVGYSWKFFQAIVLSSIVAAMVMMAIGDSLARGLGMLGALAIIRFRTLLRDPRNIIFIFASLCVGIAAGVYGFAIAISGTVIFCVVAFSLAFYASHLGTSRENVIVFSLANQTDLPDIKGVISDYSDRHKLLSMAHNKQGLFRYEYLLRFKNNADSDDFFNQLDSDERVQNLRISTKEDLETI